MSLPKCSKQQNTRQRMTTGENDSLVYIDRTFHETTKLIAKRHISKDRIARKLMD